MTVLVLIKKKIITLRCHKIYKTGTIKFRIIIIIKEIYFFVINFYLNYLNFRC